MWIATAIHLSACKPSSQGMAGYSRDPRFEQNTARKSGNFWQDTGFDCYPESGIGQNFGHGFGLRLKIIFGISTKEVRDAELSWKRNKESGIRSPSCHATVRLNWSIVYAKTIIFFYNCIKTKTRGKLTLKLSLLVLFRQQELRCYCFLKFEEERLEGSSQEAHSFLPARDFYPGYQSPKLNSHWTAQNTRLYMKLNQK